MSTAPPYVPHYSVAEYQQWEGDWELWQGIPVAMTPSPVGGHQRCSLRLARALLTAAEDQACRAEVLQEIDWIISDDTVVRPDVVLLCGDAPERHILEAPAIVAEILSPSTADRDRNAKLKLYEDNGVSYYLIVDVQNNRVTAFKRDNDKFCEMESEETMVFDVCETCQISISIASIF